MRNPNRQNNIAFLIIAICMLFASWASAAEGDEAAGEPETGSRERTGEKVQRFVLSESEIRGALDRPQAIYLIPKMSMELGDVKLEKKFLDDADEDLFPLAEQKDDLGLRARSLSDTFRE